jgi:hypothetical protein
MGDAIDEEFAALEAAEPARRFESDDESKKKDIEPYDPDDHQDSTQVVDVIKPQIHEFSGHVLFALFESKPDIDGMRPYFGIVSAFEPDLEAEINVDDTTWAIDHGTEDDEEYKKSTIRYWDGAIATREQDSGNNYLEYQIPVYDTSDPKRNRRINFQFRPSLPNATHAETGERIQSLPETLPEGVRVEIQASNVDPDEVIDILRELSRLEHVHMILIANTESSLLDGLDRRVISRLRGCETIHFDPYATETLVEILNRRSEVGLELGAVFREILELVSPPSFVSICSDAHTIVRVYGLV